MVNKEGDKLIAKLLNGLDFTTIEIKYPELYYIAILL
eukprot:Gb_41513 [translate_table: standard]